jgi:L-glutamine-phosphate cytidylyltransferase
MKNRTQEPKAIILAAGEGTRLRPYTLARPKCLVEVEGKSLLDRQLAVLMAEGVTDVAIIGGYKGDMLRRDGIALHLNPRYYETNMVWTLFCAEEELEGGALLCYGDIVYSRQTLQALLAAPGDIAVTVDLDWEAFWRTRNEDPLGDAETLKLGADGRILEIGQKPKSLAEIEGQYMGLIKLSAAGAAHLRKVFHDSRGEGSLSGKPLDKAYMTDLLQAMIVLGYRVDSVPIYGGWVEVDTVSDLESAVTRARLSEIERDL